MGATPIWTSDRITFEDTNMAHEFRVSDYHDLLALHRVLLEGKFCADPWDLDVAASPILARLYRDLIRVIVAAEGTRGNQSRSEAWTKWLRLDRSRREWQVAVLRAKQQSQWETWDTEKKRTFVLDLLAPFEVDAEGVDKFIGDVDDPAQ